MRECQSLLADSTIWQDGRVVKALVLGTNLVEAWVRIPLLSNIFMLLKSEKHYFTIVSKHLGERCWPAFYIKLNQHDFNTCWKDMLVKWAKCQNDSTILSHSPVLSYPPESF